jgi:prepilin peptidase CpaA
VASLGLVGAGDAKFAAAMAPFVAPGDGLFFLMLFALVLIAMTPFEGWVEAF